MAIEQYPDFCRMSGTKLEKFVSVGAAICLQVQDNSSSSLCSLVITIAAETAPL
ncbi:hypothetical protein F9C07_7044 [Aspergillus flavus]|uniref:Uncharacterized protein n=1 Tax=Aspergillus flavus (strain ATCC 200026 / FGSC A1120 / IAM 13836 / NRRL 3357 / JCM 12722 / SRRC 167) TaxID=332952 RepID=A0A7U2MMT8_ASPFN|nr:hypothetical protein F9C07_7044 [Aspergillus flavus]